MEKQYNVHILEGNAIPEKWWNNFEGDFKAVFAQIFKTTPTVQRISSLEQKTENTVYLWVNSPTIFNNEQYLDFLHQLIHDKKILFKLEAEWSQIEEEPTIIKSLHTYFLDQQNDDTYWSRLLDLVYDISHQLETQDFKGTVFLAETNIEIQSIRAVIRRELLRFGYRVLPQQYLPKNPTELTNHLHENLAESDIAVHLIGDLNEESNNQFIELQNQIAASWSDKHPKLKRLIWFPLDFEIRSEEHRLYLERFKRKKEFLSNAEIVQIPIEKLKSIIKDYLDKIDSYEDINQSIINTDKKVYLIIDVDDKEEAQEAIEMLSSYACQVLMIDFTQKEANIIEQHRKCLVDADAILIFYPHSNEQWLHMKVLDILKAPGYGRKKPLLSNGILTNLSIDGLPTYIKQNTSLSTYSTQKENISDLLTTFLKPLI